MQGLSHIPLKIGGRFGTEAEGIEEPNVSDVRGVEDSAAAETRVCGCQTGNRFGIIDTNLSSDRGGDSPLNAYKEDIGERFYRSKAKA